MSFDPTKPVMPTCGGEAIIHSTSGPYITKTGVKMPIIASIKPTDYLWELSYFRADGGFCADGSKHRYDLINIPEEKWRPWTPEEVPLDAWFRETEFPDEWFKIATRWIGNVAGKKVLYVQFTDEDRAAIDLDSMFSKCQHSTDFGKTWHKCGVKIQ